MVDAVRMAVEDRIKAGDNLVAYDLIADTRDTLAGILPQLGVVLIEDANALERLRELERLKPVYGSEPVIDGGRQAGDVVNQQETAATECSGTERRRTAACHGKCPRATAGGRAGGRTC